MNNIYKLVFNEIKKYKKIYIARHIGPDPDAFGSQMALKASILLTFKDKEVFAVGTTVSKFKYFGKVDRVNDYDYENGLLIVVDTPNKSRVDIDGIDKFKNVIKIDHHPYVEKFGEVEYVNDDASSASELVFDILENTKLKIDQTVAEHIYAGIVSDTNRFLFNSESKLFIKVANLIKKYNVDTKHVYKNVYSKPLGELRLMGYIASTLKVDKYGFAYIELEDDIISSLKTDSSAASNMINDFNNIEGVYVWTFISHDEKTGQYRVNIRSRGPVINEVAAKYGGGGHKYASGVRTTDKEVVNKLISELSNECKKYLEENDKNGDN